MRTVAKQLAAFPKGTYVFKQGDEGDTFYIIKSGQVRVSVAANGGEVAELHRVMGPGDAYDKNVAKSMGQRLEKIKADAKREKAGEGRRSAAGS